MKCDDFEYELPAALIAHYPSNRRDECRLLVLQRESNTLEHRRFREIVELLRPDDCLVLNNTRVLPARVYCRRSGGGRVEVLFTEKIDDRTWKALVRPSRRLKAGSRIIIEGDPSPGVLTIESPPASGGRIVSLAGGSAAASIDELMETHGLMPLPPYIRRQADARDREQYQTVFAQEPGAIAAPTAGLHFTPELLALLAEKGIHYTFVTLHVGAGTFLPVKVPDPRNHVMHEERFELAPAAAQRIMETKRAGGRVIAVGTTCVRVLEHCAVLHNTLGAQKGRTSLMILPPYDFRIVDGLITNFHLPRSTLLMLVCAFSSRKKILEAYTQAIQKGYRFYSYGDAMLII
ncbi:MAG: tRNA preQ1(34) S-adenosylmethionine ribosyltransferase-isomerase QueA [Chitinispirillaceae bacterium]|nr:tRNA preQ1(34) S-adenosylmethionine ribosyltransferase-isomerase QueA [Chitinispirillaceae bacterium]